MGGIFGFFSDLLFGKAPDPNKGLVANAEATRDIGAAQVKLGNDVLDFTKQQYADTLPIFQQLSAQQLRIADANEARAEDYQKYWLETYKPLEQDLVKQANEFDTAGNREALAQQAQADIGSQYSNVQQQLTRQLGRYGINPNSGEFASLNANLMRDKALQTAGAMTGTRLQAQQMGTAMKYNAAQLGRGLPGNASQAYGLAVQSGNSAGANAQAPGQEARAGYGMASSIYGGAVGAYGTSSNIYGMDYNQRFNTWKGRAEMGMKGINQMAGIAGTAMGWNMADGGKVEGPGGPKSDDVPAMLSDGEYVVPAAVVKRLGVRHFDELIAKHGDRGNKQALRERKGLKGR